MTIWLELTPIPYCVTYVDADGIATRALRAGTGAETVLFLHGTSGSLEAFARNVVPHVEAGYSVHAIDLLGHGYTDKPDHPYEIPVYAQHVLAYLDACEIERAHFVGESLGGWISAWIASEHPDRVSTLQLVAAGGTKARPEVMERIKRSTTEAVMSEDRELTRARLHLLHFDPVKDSTEELVDVRYRYYHLPSFQRNLHNLLCLQELDVRTRNLLDDARLARIACPTLVVWGHENPFGDVPEARAMHEAIPGSELVLFDRCGHWPQHEHAARYNRLSVEFISSYAADRGAVATAD